MEAMQKLENNSYSKEPVKTSYGYHVIYRIDQKEKPALEDVKEEIIDSLVSEKKKYGNKIINVSRFKGLGEMDYTQLRETVLDPRNRLYNYQ